LAINEWLVLASLLILGGAVALGHNRFGPLEMGGFTLAGLFHGMAYAEAVIGAEMGPIVAYLLGFSLIQAAIAIGAMLLVKSLWQNEKLALNARLGGAVVTGIAIAFTIEGVEGLIFSGVA
jgi:urease accessory protein